MWVMHLGGSPMRIEGVVVGWPLMAVNFGDDLNIEGLRRGRGWRRLAADGSKGRSGSVYRRGRGGWLVVAV